VCASEALRTLAERSVRTHPLRAAGAMQLGAALVASDGAAGALRFVSLDMRQREAAQREGFPVLPDTAPKPRPVRERRRRR
jgi:hypothetical protein